ncbi:MAG: transglutaminase, partial [[Clostridium] innocuum]
LFLLLTVILQRRMRIAYREKQCLQRDANKAVYHSYRYLLIFMKDEELPKTIHSLCEKAIYSPHTMTKEEAELVYGYAQKQARKLLRRSSFIKRWRLRYLLALG